MFNALANYSFPDAYYTVISGASAVKYVSATGSDSNNGNTPTTPYLTISQALSATSATATSVAIVILSGTYSITPQANGSTYGTSAITDSNKPRLFVGAPGKVKIQFTYPSAYGPYAVDFQNSGSACYGIIFERNNAGKTNSYEVAVFCGSATVGNLKGNFYNCAFTETNANGLWSLQYDNEGRIASQVNNCTFKFGAAALGDYSGSTGLNINYCVFNQANPGGSSTKSNTLYSQTVNATTYAVTGVTTSGVYSGTYSWSGTTSTSSNIVATGGTTSTVITNGLAIKTHTFTTSGSFSVTSFGAGDTFDYIVVGGGGGGTYNNYVGSGGGGAQVTYGNTNAAVATYTVTIGNGGAGKSGGGYGGGALGGTSSLVGSTVNASALGGPGSGMNGNPDATGTYTYGTGTAYTGAGAGGAGQAGQGSNGGNGKLITSGTFATNTTYYGGGGAGGLASASGFTSLSGGLGGGANTTLTGGQPATPNSGGGGAGGSAAQGTTASSGASGVVVISYLTTIPNGVYSPSSVSSGANITFTIYSSTTGNVPYTITGITSDIISNAALTGNFVVSSGSGTVTFTTKSFLTSTYSMSLTAEGSTANVSINPNVSISTTVTGIGYITNLALPVSPINGQLNIPDMVTTVAQYDKGGSTQSTYPIAGQMNIYDNPVTVTDSLLGTKPLLPVFGNMQSNASIPYTTITTSTAGPLQQGVIKLFGDNPNREYWM